MSESVSEQNILKGINVSSETTKKCPKCGSTEIIKHELRLTAVRNDGTKQVEAGCGRCGAVMTLIRETPVTWKFECPNCGRRVVWSKKSVEAKET